MKKILKINELQLKTLLETISQQDNNLKYTTKTNYSLGQKGFDYNLETNNVFKSLGTKGPDNSAVINKLLTTGKFINIGGTPSSVLFSCKKQKKGSDNTDLSYLHLVYKFGDSYSYNPVYNNELEANLKQTFC